MLAVAESFQALFRAIASALDLPIRALRDLLVGLPWPVSILLAAVTGHAAGGWRIATFTAAGLFYIVAVGFWPEAMMTLSVVGVAVLAAVAFGLVLGILMHRSSGVRRVVEPTLDIMQTVPTFSYLVPILVLFGLGPVVGMIAAAIYAIPPMARNAYLSLSRVPHETVEAGRMAGSTPLQLLAWVQMPSAVSGMLLGINQAIMAVLSMAVIASILGGVPDIGWEVYLTMKRAQFGESIVAGMVIAVMAMILDRISRGFAEHGDAGHAARAARHLKWLVAAAAAVSLLLSAKFVPALNQYPTEWELNLAAPLNQAVQWFTATFFVATETLKNTIVFYLLLPLKVGFAGSVRPQTWGFDLGVGVIVAYAAACSLVAVCVGAWRGWRAGAAVLLLAVVYFFGTTGMPWLVLILIWAVIAWQVAGLRIAGLTVASFAFIALSGFWDGAMVTLQLCGAGVIVSFILGGILGI